MLSRLLTVLTLVSVVALGQVAPGENDSEWRT